ncbi:hypothetical protein EDD68_11537 [Melghiribacillus thermohalophilus]|uniref:Major facilitator superfamily (MFS) profile domain-containing protein n=1 Tax=Melghiribacillus thermohalophilus TaxID=1324956 RepID=A0A4R3MW65_9BACI|nr:hypothetical protein EDD68_11537 [Melghiribacillus thermohalophilus]
MQMIYLIISCIFSILSGLPYLFIASDYNFFSIVTFGSSGLFAMFLPLIYAIIGLLFGLLLEKSSRRIILLICSSGFLFVNLIYVIAVGIML